MKNFNRRSAAPLVTTAQSATNWPNTHTHVDRTHAYINSHNHVVQSASSAITEFGIKLRYLRYSINLIFSKK